MDGLLGRLAYARVCENFHDEARQLITEALNTEGAVRIHDLYNSAAEVYLALGEDDQAAECARMAYETAWADGDPYVWRWRLERAQAVLSQLGLPLPDMPTFDEALVGKLPYEDEIYAFIDSL